MLFTAPLLARAVFCQTGPSPFWDLCRFTATLPYWDPAVAAVAPSVVAFAAAVAAAGAVTVAAAAVAAAAARLLEKRSNCEAHAQFVLHTHRDLQ